MLQSLDYQAIKYPVADKAIEKMTIEYSQLTIEGIDDKQGYKAVDEARKEVKKKRIEVEHKRKELKEDALKFGRAVDEEAKRITGLLSSLENNLQSMTKAIDDEKERIIREAEEKERKRIQERFDKLNKYNFSADYEDVKSMDDTNFEVLLLEAKEGWEAEQQKIKQEAKAREEENKRLALENERLQAEKRRLDEQQKAIDAANEKIRLEKEAQELKIKQEEARIKRENELIEARKKAAEEAAKKERERIEEEARQTKLKAEQEEARKIREEQLRPDKDKLELFAKYIDDIKLPMLSHEDANKISSNVKVLLGKVSKYVREEIQKI